MVPFGDAVVATEDTVIGVELCEELFTPASYASAFLTIELIVAVRTSIWV